MRLNRVAVIITPFSGNVAVPANAKSPSSGLFAKDSETVLCRISFRTVEIIKVLGLDHVQAGDIEPLKQGDDLRVRHEPSPASATKRHRQWSTVKVSESRRGKP